MSQVSLEAPEGGLPRENLEPLLRVRQGEPLDPQDVRQDLALLYRVAPFEAVEAHAEPWVTFGPDGEAVEAVILVYRVFPAPRIKSIELTGLRGEVRREASAALGLTRGGALYTDPAAGQLVEVEQRVASVLAAAGWPEARVRLAFDTLRSERFGREVKVYVNVDPGDPQEVAQLTIAGDIVDAERALRRRLRRVGLAEGRRVSAATLADAREALKQRLVDQGHLEARVNVVYTATEGGDHVSVLVDAGPRLVLERTGRGLPRDKALREVLSLGAGDRVTGLPLDELEERVEGWYRTRGRFEADATVSAREETGELGQREVHVEIAARRGRPHVLGRTTFHGATAFKPGYLRGALEEAAPETLGREIVTRDAVEAALGVLQDFYRSEGFLDASLSLVDLRPARISARGVKLDVDVVVVEGPRTVLVALSSQGGARPGRGARAIEEPILDRAREQLLGQPYNPASMESLARELVLAYRDQGYLNADVRPLAAVTLEEAEGANPASRQSEARVVFGIEPGQQIRLRALLIEGNRRTRRRVIERELRLAIGEPVTPDGIDQTRAALYDLDLFRAVSPELVGEDDRSRDLVLHLEERPNLLFELGGGISTDEGALLKARAAHRNLGGIGHRLSLLGQFGYGWVGDTWSFDVLEPVWKAALRYEAPYVPARGYRMFTDVVLQETVQEPTWRLVRSGASVGISARWSDHAEGVLDYHIQRRSLDDVDPGALVQGEPWWPVDADQPSSPTAQRLQGGLGFTWLSDWRDDRFNPTSGTLFTLDVELGDPLSSGYLFAKGESRLEQLIPVGPLVVGLSGHGGIGWAAGGRATLALEDRFTLGGSSSLRGFHLDTVGPANRVVRPDIDYPDGIEPIVDGTGLADTPTHWVPTGGDALLALSAELRVPLTSAGAKGTSLVLFSDAGHVSFLDQAIITTSRLEDRERLVRVSLGAGLHLPTPIGPASLDLAVNLDPIEAYDEPWLLPHLSLGAL